MEGPTMETIRRLVFRFLVWLVGALGVPVWSM